MNADERERLARVEQKMADTIEDVREMKSDVKQILTTLNQAKGGWKGIMWVAGISGSAGAAVAALAAFVGAAPLK